MLHRSAVKLALIAIVSLLVVAGATSSACSKKSESSGDIAVTSSVNAGHSHDITISGTDINNPPSASKTIDTTTNYAHYHTVTLTPQDYQTIKDGGQVVVTTSVVNDHTHDFTIQKS